MAGDNYIPHQENVKVKNRCWNAYITSSLRDLYIKTELCDTILTTGTGSHATNKVKTLLESELLVNKSLFPVHKCVLGAVSPYLKSLFKEEPMCYEFTVPLVTGDALRHVLDFIYSGDADVPTGHIDDVFCAAVVLQIESLQLQIKKAITKHPSHWDQLRSSTLYTLHPEPRSRRKREPKSEERDEYMFTDSERSSSVHSNEDKRVGDTSNELLQHLIMENKGKELTPPPPPLSPPKSHMPDPIHQPVFPCSQPVFPGQEEPPEMPEALTIEPEVAHKDSDSDEHFTPPVKSEPPVTDRQKQTSPSPSTSRENPAQNGHETESEKPWTEYQPPIVIEPSMAYNLFEMAQRHGQQREPDKPTAERYGFPANSLHTDPPSTNNDAGRHRKFGPLSW